MPRFNKARYLKKKKTVPSMKLYGVLSLKKKKKERKEIVVT